MALDLRGGNSILGLMGHIQEQGELGRQEGNKRGLAGLLSKGMTANPMQQREMLAKGAAIDPSGTMKVAGILGQQNEDALDHFGKLSAAAAANPNDPHLLRQWAQAGAQINMLPPEVLQKDFSDPADIEGAGKAVQAYARAFGGAGAPEQYTLAPGAARYDASGNMIAERPTAPPRQDYIFQTGADGQGYWLPKPTGMPQAPTAGAPAPSTGGGQQVMDSAYQGAGFGSLRDAVEYHESRNNPNAVSPAGAVGRMQTMPDTLTDPGYGVQPARDQSDAERTRVGNEYLQAMLQKYGSPELALAAYNAGPGRVDEALQQAGGDPQRALSMLPQETQQYVPRVLASAGGQGGPVAPQVASGGAIPVPGFRGAPKGQNAPSGYQYAPDGQSLVPIPGGPADRKNNPVASDLAKGEMGMRKELEGRVKDQRVVVDMFQKVQSAAQKPSAPNDLALIFAYMKMLDPGSVVREAEFANAQNAAGVPDQIRNVWNRAQRGERLNDDQRAAFLRSASEIYGVASQAITRQTREYQGMADEYGYDPRRSTGSPDFRQVQGGSSESAPVGGDISSMSNDDLLRALGQ